MPSETTRLLPGRPTALRIRWVKGLTFLTLAAIACFALQGMNKARPVVDLGLAAIKDGIYEPANTPKWLTDQVHKIMADSYHRVDPELIPTRQSHLLQMDLEEGSSIKSTEQYVQRLERQGARTGRLAAFLQKIKQTSQPAIDSDQAKPEPRHVPQLAAAPSHREIDLNSNHTHGNWSMESELGLQETFALDIDSEYAVDEERDHLLALLQASKMKIDAMRLYLASVNPDFAKVAWAVGPHSDDPSLPFDPVDADPNGTALALVAGFADYETTYNTLWPQCQAGMDQNKNGASSPTLQRANNMNGCYHLTWTVPLALQIMGPFNLSPPIHGTATGIPAGHFHFQTLHLVTAVFYSHWGVFVRHQVYAGVKTSSFGYSVGALILDQPIGKYGQWRTCDDTLRLSNNAVVSTVRTRIHTWTVNDNKPFVRQQNAVVEVNLCGLISINGVTIWNCMAQNYGHWENLFSPHPRAGCSAEQSWCSPTPWSVVRMTLANAAVMAAGLAIQIGALVAVVASGGVAAAPLTAGLAVAAAGFGDIILGAGASHFAQYAAGDVWDKCDDKNYEIFDKAIRYYGLQSDVPGFHPPAPTISAGSEYSIDPAKVK
mmetsp:Transcript_75526/g.177338  ORF Transcript_75526/g.177338 Transcript_75526/m.177338 type:complete len:602 (-) Transcript_75526:78-1883(-)|eukprot:CAMPEP_0175805518 /NCGR_PEP_ID=MMETSP0107_2-20121207/701_1 /TAXON_ID=195067 ORGANISM="Goniomonas pacifica, Strain CCMP1869" /NCGR_SAMPLE_ID=MMETSP0107_2 /ASSEMBLY_ACC=CAM_ASM_000203 /LENGTH=601 /DNA_ID=CAMNT_0017116949 /DNA_START=33 /DNA_END=1838 /DNA_ORIENTATION=+